MRYAVNRYNWVTFTSDYGLEDNFVGVCHGVIARIAPHARVIDVSHAVAAHDVRHGATVLEQAVRYLPAAVHLAVVDPGVGTARGQVLVEAGRQALVGPDNGLLVAAAEALGGIERAFALVNPDYRLSPVSRTFHGRDLFAPAAAHLAAGVDPAAFGPELDPASLVRLPAPATAFEEGRLLGEVLLVDHFGNLALSLRPPELERAGVRLGEAVEIRVGEGAWTAAFVETFAAVPPGRLAIHEDSSQRVSISVNQGRASERLGARAGDRVVLSRAGD